MVRSFVIIKTLNFLKEIEIKLYKTYFKLMVNSQ